MQVDEQVGRAIQVRPLEEIFAWDHVSKHRFAAPWVARSEQCRAHPENRLAFLLAADDATRFPAGHVEEDAREVVQLVAERDGVLHVDRTEADVRLQAAREPSVAQAKELLAEARWKASQRNLFYQRAAAASPLSKPKQAFLGQKAIEVQHFVRRAARAVVTEHCDFGFVAACNCQERTDSLVERFIDP